MLFALHMGLVWCRTFVDNLVSSLPVRFPSPRFQVRRGPCLVHCTLDSRKSLGSDKKSGKNLWWLELVKRWHQTVVSAPALRWQSGPTVWSTTRTCLLSNQQLLILGLGVSQMALSLQIASRPNERRCLNQPTSHYHEHRSGKCFTDSLF